MPLIEIKTGQRAVVKEIIWGDQVRRRLLDMGMIPGTAVSMVSAASRGPVILEVRGSRLALGRGIVAKIEVEPIA